MNNDYKSLLSKLRPESVAIEIDGHDFLVKKLSAGDAEEIKVYGFRVDVSEGGKSIDMAIDKREWVDRNAFIVSRCLLCPDGTPFFENIADANNVKKDFFDAALEKINEVNDLSPEAPEIAEGN